MLRAFVGAGLADHRAQGAERRRMRAAARHQADREPAYLGTVDVERNAARHRPRIGLAQAGGGAAVAGIGAVLASVDARGVVRVGHVVSPSRHRAADAVRIAVGDRQVELAPEVVDRHAQPVLEIDARMPVQVPARSRNVGAAPVRIIGRQRPALQRASGCRSGAARARPGRARCAPSDCRC